MTYRRTGVLIDPLVSVVMPVYNERDTIAEICSLRVALATAIISQTGS